MEQNLAKVNGAGNLTVIERQLIRLNKWFVKPRECDV